jgi:hypothetical protein
VAAVDVKTSTCGGGGFKATEHTVHRHHKKPPHGPELTRRHNNELTPWVNSIVRRRVIPAHPGVDLLAAQDSTQLRCVVVTCGHQVLNAASWSTPGPGIIGRPITDN